jgi:hypothetical protein
LSTISLKGKQWKDMSLLTLNMKPRVFHNGHKCILNGIVRNNPFPTMGATEKVGFQGLHKTMRFINVNRQNTWRFLFSPSNIGLFSIYQRILSSLIFSYQFKTTYSNLKSKFETIVSPWKFMDLSKMPSQ